MELDKEQSTSVSLGGDSFIGTATVLDALVLAHHASPDKSRERSLLITKLQEARMWADEAYRNAPDEE